MERDLAKVEAAGSSPVSRSEKCEKTDTKVSVFLRFSERREVDEKPPRKFFVIKFSLFWQAGVFK